MPIQTDPSRYLTPTQAAARWGGGMTPKRMRFLVRKRLVPRVSGGYAILIPRRELEIILAGPYPGDADSTAPWTEPATASTTWAAEYLGFRAERVRRLINAGSIEALRIGGRLYVLIRPLARSQAFPVEA